MGPVRAVVFDFDYTLADSSEGAVECINYALSGLGLPTAPAAAVCRTIGHSLPETLARLAGAAHTGRSGEFAGLFIRRADEVMADLTVLYPGVGPTAEALRQRGLKLGIVSTKFRRRIEAVLAREGLRGAFDLIVGGEDVGRHKPDPEGLLQAMGRLGTDTSTTLYVGDSVVDAETARRAGVPFVAVLSGQTGAEEFAAYPVAGVVAGLPELVGWVSAG
jgi:phosphoglycolate phosphatase